MAANAAAAAPDVGRAVCGRCGGGAMCLSKFAFPGGCGGSLPPRVVSVAVPPPVAVVGRVVLGEGYVRCGAAAVWLVGGE